MATNDALRLLLPGYLHVVGLFASAILAWAAISSLLHLPRPRTTQASRPLWRVATVSLVALVALAVWVEGLPFGSTRASRFASLCESAGPQIHRRVTGVQGVLLEDETPRCPRYNNIGPPSGHSLRANSGVRFVEYLNGASVGGYRRDTGELVPPTVSESLAEVVIRTRTVVTDGDIDAGICGEEVTVIERASNTPLAVYRYFWTDTHRLSFRRCPEHTRDVEVTTMVSEAFGPATRSVRSTSGPVVQP